MRLLLAEDDPDLARSLKLALAEAGYAVDLAADGAEAGFLGETEPYDIVVLDLGLPVVDGVSVLRRWRSAGVSTPVLILTARDGWAEKVEGFDAGGDDYLTKPFNTAELLARLRALLRRPEPLLAMQLCIADCEIDLQSHAVSRGGAAIALTAKEFALLELLARRAGTVVSRADIVAHVWDDNHDPFTNAVEVYVNRLRGKIDRAPWVPLIHTRRGAGYMLTATPPA